MYSAFASLLRCNFAKHDPCMMKGLISVRPMYFLRDGVPFLCLDFDLLLFFPQFLCFTLFFFFCVLCTPSLLCLLSLALLSFSYPHLFFFIYTPVFRCLWDSGCTTSTSKNSRLLIVSNCQSSIKKPHIPLFYFTECRHKLFRKDLCKLVVELPRCLEGAVSTCRLDAGARRTGGLRQTWDGARGIQHRRGAR